MCDIFDEIPTVRDGQIVSEGCEVSEEVDCITDGSDCADDAEVISAEDAEVIQDYPDTSEDVDIEPKYRRLVDFYLTCGNKKKAAKLAGFNASTDKALRVMASRAFKRDDVKLYYKLKSQELSKKADLTFEAYMAELVSIATFDIKDAVETEKIPSLTNDEVYVVRFKNIEDIPEFARKAVKSIEIAKDGTPKMVFYDKLQALKLLGEIKGYIQGQGSDEEEENGVVFIPSVDFTGEKTDKDNN